MVEGTDASPEQGGRPRVLNLVSDRAIHLLVGFSMGLAVYGLMANAEWLRANAQIAYPSWVLAFFWPTLFLLAYRRERSLRALVWVSGFCALLVLLAAYTGWQVSTPYANSILMDWLVFGFADAFGLSMLVASFVALIHLQPAIWGGDRAYETFFTLSWRNFLTVVLSALLTLGVWIVTFLWAQLFELIGIGFFGDLFEEDWFMCPVLGMSFALGLNSFGTASSVIDRVSTLLSRFFWLLLPILAVATTCFLVALPFTGLEPLWDSNLGTGILLTASLWGLFFLNAVYQTGQRLPYPRTVHRVLSVAIMLFPLLSGLAAYGLALRIAQHGWTPDRCWALLIIVLTALFSLGYATIIGWRRDDWPSSLPWINRHMSWVVVGSLLLTASPLLDFRSVSAWSQIARVESGEVLPEDLDVEHFRRDLGRSGRLRLEALLASLDDTDPGVARSLRDRLAGESPVRGWTPLQQAEVIMRPERFVVADDLASAIAARYTARRPDLLFRLDLGGGETPEIVAMWIQSGHADIHCLTRLGARWVSCGYDSLRATGQSREELLQQLSAAEFEAVIPDRPYKHLRVGEHRLLDGLRFPAVFTEALESVGGAADPPG